MERFQLLVTSWRALYTMIGVIWAIVLAANEIHNKDNWTDTLGDEIGGRNWVHIVAAVGLGAGVLTVLLVGWALAMDRGDWRTACTPWARLRRVLFELSVKLVALCTVALASIYFYVNQDDAMNIRGRSYSVILGAIFLALTVVDQLFFVPSLGYIELMASPCLRPATRNCRMNVVTGETVAHRSMHSAQLSRILGVLPFIGSLGDDKLDVGGVPVALLVTGGYNSDQQQHFQSAAKILIQNMQDMYQV